MAIDYQEGRSQLRVPPSNLDAEESVLGAAMISADAVNTVMDHLDPSDFYKPAHQLIFEAIAELFDANQPVDAITVSDALGRREQLDRMGGIAYLAGLIDKVPTASNVDYYATIVEENSQRRRLLEASSAIGGLAFEDADIAEVMDQAEQAIYKVAEKRMGEGLVPVSPLINSTLEKIEELGVRGSDITGVPTGFKDLDRKLAGLHPANLVVIAARPSMGKCLTGDAVVVDPKTGNRHTIEQLVADRGLQEGHHLLALDLDTMELAQANAVDFIDNGVRETFTLATRLGRIITATSNHPFLTATGWRQLDELAVGDAIATPRVMDAFGVDELPEAEVIMLGYLLGDGSLSGTTPGFTTADPRILEEFTHAADRLDLDVSVHGPERTAPFYRLVGRRGPSQKDVASEAGVSSATVSLALGRHSSRLSPATVAAVQDAVRTVGYRNNGTAPKNQFTARLEELGLAGTTSHTKFVPEPIFRLPKEQLAVFLSRLFATDGSAWVDGNIYRVEYTSVSERLARDVQHLLLRFGVVAKLRKRLVKYKAERRPAFDVSIQDPQNVRAFARQIGIFSKEDQLARVLTVADSRSTDRSTAALLPMDVWDLVLEEKADRSWADVSEASGRSRNHNWHVRRRRLSRRLLGELAATLGSSRLALLADSDVVWDQVTSVEPAGRQRVYDLTVPVHHNFVANDLIVHNSTLATNIAQNVAMKGHPVAIFTLEMSRDEVVQRLLCSLGRVDSQKLRTGQLGEQQWQRLATAAGTLFEAPIYVDDSASLTVTEIRAKCRRLKRQRGLELVVVDYIQLMTGGNRRTENRQQEIAEISRSLKNLARELHVPIIAVSQLNRSLEQRQDKRPMLGDLRESGAIEQDSDVVMFIYRDEYYHPENLENKGVAEVNVAKHRAGATGRVDMTFLGEFTLFSDLGRDVAI
ncbi:MAG: replicative DNA helicase [Acidimicrobiia bacterium]|nr:replicative DNA helicase [Acidimicrobiia bacterium]